MHLSSLYRFPLKSAAGEALPQARSDALGLVGDRRWMVVAAGTGRFLTQRAVPQMALLQASWQGTEALRLSAPGMDELRVAVPGTAEMRSVQIWRSSAVVPDAGEAAATWLTRFLGQACRLVYLPAEEGIQVDLDYAQLGERTAFSDGFPFLLIGQASLDDLVQRVGRPLEMLRFRPNLVISGAQPYAEDGWKRIRIGELEFRVVKPCSRCVIPTIDPATAERDADREPLATLLGYRKGEGGVFFGQNLIAEGTGELALGMPVEVLE
ncbi:MOSC domain-containing protein [Pseudomonas lopnurensis]|uniref:MOSC domain-containing protein n=1 Tax=Pseudomonas lopnurensis TaxID=1477517 RepID=UPI001879D6D0|nr:MOSC domain-containing protein [Pseudomonas lopnurensis]MBE7374593.1 MOSC domain-containing protein [Pseudomonas lopnurensis]